MDAIVYIHGWYACFENFKVNFEKVYNQQKKIKVD